MGTRSSKSKSLTSSTLKPTEAEIEFQNAIIEAAELTGWIYYHTHDSRRSPKGFPDLVLAHPQKGVVFLECKTEVGVATEEQIHWLYVLKTGGSCAELVRPADWDWIQRVLNEGPWPFVDYHARS